MGRDWYWGGANRSSSNSKRGGDGPYKHTVNGRSTVSAYSTSSCTTTTTTTTTPASGCMSAVFHFFDFHHYQFPLYHDHHQPPSSPSPPLKPTFPQLPLHDQEEPISLKGVEAPRNSLELAEEVSLSSTSKEEESLNIPIGIHIKTSREGDTRSSASYNDFSSEILSCSPGGSKTPNLVARLMGLDLLPDNNPSSSPSSSSNLGTPSLQTKPYALLHCYHSRRTQTLHSKQLTSHRNSVDGYIRGTRSLPETPRISSARRSDVEHRLSLQLNKENMCGSDELEFSRFSSLRRKEFKQEDENRSSREYARQIVKQVKESVSRKVGMDITNTVKNRDHHELVAQLKSKKSSRFSTRADHVAHHDSSPGKSTPSCSPRLRFLESRSKPSNNSTTSSSSMKEKLSQQPKPQLIQPSSLPQADTQPELVKIPTRPKLSLPVMHEEHQQQNNQQRPIKKCKKESERFGSRLTKSLQTTDIVRNKQEEPFARPSIPNKSNVIIPDKKCRKTPLSNDLLKITVPISLLPVKKDPSPPATKLVQKQVTEAQASKRSSQLSSCSSQTYKQEATRLLIVRDSKSDDRCKGNPISIPAPNTTTKTAAYGAEHEYVTRIIRRTGIDKHARVSFARWYSPSHPLDPSIFHYLEHLAITTPGSHAAGKTELSLRCNRKLLFHLVDEILVEMLKPEMNMKPWANPVGRRDCYSYTGSELINMLCSRVRSFPCADCRVLEDIDALIDRDISRNDPLQLQGRVAFEEEGEGIVGEIERDIVDTLVYETAADLWVLMWERNGSV